MSLFIGLILLIVGNQNKYCQSFGFIFFAVGIIFMAVERTNKIDKRRIEIDKILEENMENDDFDDVEMIELQDESARLLRQRRKINISFYICGILFILVGIFILI